MLRRRIPQAFQLHVLLPFKTIEQLDELAARKGLAERVQPPSRSEMVREAISLWIERERLRLRDRIA